MLEIDRLEHYISQRLLNLSPISVYNRKAGDEATFPYLVFKIYDCNYFVRHRKDWVLEIDYWNDSADDTAIIAAAISVKNGRTVGETTYIGLNWSTQDETEGFYRCLIDMEGNIPDQEADMSRYHQKYTLYVD